MVNRHQFQQLAKSFRAGKLTLEEFSQQGFNAPEVSVPKNKGKAAETHANVGRASVRSIDVDLDRQRRCGWPEVVYGEGKSRQQILDIAATLNDAGQPVLVTRIDQEIGDALAEHLSGGQYHSQARTFRFNQDQTAKSAEAIAGSVAVVSAGTSDQGVAAEAAETLRWMGIEPVEINDVGVAGPGRLEKHLPTLKRCRVIVVVAGMEGALPSVMAGHVACPIFAVPTSVGYGANLGGISAFLTMLNSCAANVAVVNIDAGFKAGYVAGMVGSNAEFGMRNSE